MRGLRSFVSWLLVGGLGSGLGADCLKFYVRAETCCGRASGFMKW